MRILCILFISLFSFPLSLSLLTYSSWVIFFWAGLAGMTGNTFYSGNSLLVLLLGYSFFSHDCHKMEVWPPKLLDLNGKAIYLHISGLLQATCCPCLTILSLSIRLLLWNFWKIFSSCFHLSVFEHEPAWKECTEGPEDKKNYSQGKTKCHPNHSLCWKKYQLLSSWELFYINYSCYLFQNPMT